jgi:hypothetical protein
MKPICLFHCAEKGLLGAIFSRGGILKEAIAGKKDLSPVALEEPGKMRGLAGSHEEADRFLVRKFLHTWLS